MPLFDTNAEKLRKQNLKNMEDKRLQFAQELDRMGFEKVFIPVGGIRDTHLEHTEVVEVKFLSQLMHMLFSRKQN